MAQWINVAAYRSYSVPLTINKSRFLRKRLYLLIWFDVKLSNLEYMYLHLHVFAIIN